MRSPIAKLLSTETIVKNETYIKSSKIFFARFPNAWENTTNQVLKLETRQEYLEDDESFFLLQKGKLKAAIALLKKTHKGNKKLYAKLSKRKVDFIRCRPVVKPLSNYIKWEFEAYKINILQGEKIFCVDRNKLKTVFNETALHDFMIFDSSLAFVHHYDIHGQIQGGWQINDKGKIQNLIMLFSIIKAESVEFSIFIKKYLR